MTMIDHYHMVNMNLNSVMWRATFLLAASLVVASIQTCRGDKVAPSSSTESDATDSTVGSGNGIGDGAPTDDRIVQSLFRFPATKLGPEFNDVLQNWYTDWFHVPKSNMTAAKSANHLPPITPEQAGWDHAFYSVATPAATIFRRQCYGPTPATTKKSLYDSFEQRRKAISFEYLRDPDQERIMLHKMTKRLYSAFLDAEKDEELTNNNLSSIHKKKSRSTIDTVYAQTTLPLDYDSPSKLSFKTFAKTVHDDTGNRTSSSAATTQQWTWQTPALFSERGSTNFIHFRQTMYFAMRAQQLIHRLQLALPSFTGWAHGRQSGMFWYPPGGVREWHNNKYDLGHEMTKLNPADREAMKSQVWRMYFVRTVRDTQFDNKLEKLTKKSCDGNSNDHSGMHIIPGKDAGLTMEVLRSAGARPLTKDEKRRQWSDEFAEDYVIPSSADLSNETEPGSDYDDGNSFDRNSVWRVPDQDGYVTFFRLPDIWHCIISEEVHRYSLGFAFSEKEVQALLKLAGVDFDVAPAPAPDHDENSRMDKKDEL